MYTNIHENIINFNDDFNNERTHFFIKISLSYFILERVMLCVRDELETRTDCNIDPSSPLDHSSISFSSWLGVAQPRATEGWFSRWHPVSNWLEPSGHLVILLSNTHLLLLFFRLFTQVHLLIDGSVEGQYITILQPQLSFIASGRSSGWYPVSSHSCCMYVWAGRTAFAQPYVGVHKSTSLMSLSLFLQ